DSLRELPEMFTRLAEALMKSRQLRFSDVADRADSELIEGPARNAADAPQPPHGQGIEEFAHARRLDDDEPVGFLEVAGDLRQKFVGRHPDRRNQMHLISN